LQHAFASTQCAGTASSAVPPADVRSVAQEVNREGLEAFRKLSIDTQRTIALSPVALWYSQFVDSMETRQPLSPQAIAEAQAFSRAFLKVPGRELTTRISVNAGRLRNSNRAFRLTLCANGGASQNAEIPAWVQLYIATEQHMASTWMRQQKDTDAETPLNQFTNSVESVLGTHDPSKPAFSAVTIFQQGATLDSSTSPEIVSVRPTYWNHRGVTGVRMDSTASRLSLYIFGSIERLPLVQFLNGLNVETWPAIMAGFKPQSNLGQNSAQWLSGTARLGASSFPSVEYGRLSVSRTTIDISSASVVQKIIGGRVPAPNGSAREQRGQILGAQNRVYVVVDQNTGVIVFIGANVESEHVRGTL
jgi:hypothetical protein